MGVIANLQEEIQFFCEKRIVIVQVEAEKWERLHGRAAPGDNLRTSVGDEVQCGKFLEDADRVSSTENSYRARQANVFCARSRRAQDDHWG